MYITNILIAIPQNTMLLDRKIEMHGTLLLFCLVFFFFNVGFNSPGRIWRCLFDWNLQNVKAEKYFLYPDFKKSVKNKGSVSMYYSYSDKRTEAYGCLGCWAIIQQGFEDIIHRTKWCPGTVHVWFNTTARLGSDLTWDMHVALVTLRAIMSLATLSP